MPKVLVIDDSPDVHAIVRVRLAKEDVEILAAHDADTGIAAALRHDPDLILLDVDMPGRDGFDACKVLKSQPLTMEIPVIFLTGMASTGQKIRGLELGAVDYVTKPFDPAELRARVRAALRTKELVDLLSRKAMVDGLTGLWNRAYFDTSLCAQTAAASRANEPLSCIMADVDHFKSVNDTHGHAYGDETLRRIASLFGAHCRPDDVVCRYGGEEVGILLPRTTAPAAAEVAERLRQQVESHPFRFRDQDVRVTCSFGVGQFALDAAPSPVDLADAALYQAKRAGRNRVEIASTLPLPKVA